MTNPFFSICIAAFNPGGFLDECLLSIASQDCPDYEVIVVDDGSDDPIVLDSNVAGSLPSVYVERVPNCGPYFARQEAFELARGEVIVCVDSDDKLLDSSMLSKLKKAFVDYGADVVLYNATSDEKHPSKFLDLTTLGDGGLVNSCDVWHIFTSDYSLNSLWCKAFKRRLFTKGEKSRPRLLMAEDRLQSLEVMRNARTFLLLDEPMYFYRPNPESTTRSGYVPEYYRQICYVEDEILALMKEREMEMGEWAQHFLSLTCGVLLGLRYNSALGWDERRMAYQMVIDEHAFRVAAKLLPCCRPSCVDRTWLSLLEGGKFRFLDICMFPWKVGSSLKHFPERIAKCFVDSKKEIYK